MRALVVPAALLLVALLAPLAGAQTPFQSQACRAPVLVLQDPPPPLAPGSEYTFHFAIENPNGPPVDAVRVTVSTTAPAGWTAVPAQRDVTLGPRNFTFNALAITVPNRGTGEAAGNITVLVTFICTSGDIQTSSFATTGVPVAIEGFQVPWPFVLGAFAVLAGGVTVLGLRRLRRGVAFAARDAERVVAPGKVAKFTFVVENRRGKPQSLRLAAEGVPEGWGLHLALVDLELEPGEEKALWAILRAPAQATLGAQVDLVLRLLDEEGREQARMPLRARVAEEG